MTTEEILDALIHADAEQKKEIANSILEACENLKEVRTGEDFEVVCWNSAEALEKALGLEEED